MNNRVQHRTPVALALVGSTSTSVKYNRRSPDYQGDPVRKIAVVAVDEHGDVRGALEARLMRDLRARSQEALTPVDLLSLPDIRNDPAAAPRSRHSRQFVPF